MDKMCFIQDTHSVEDSPEQGEEVYVITRDNEVTLCTYSGGMFWPDHFYTIDIEEILFWGEGLKFVSGDWERVSEKDK